MLPETLAKLAKIPNIVGVKEASGSLKQMSDVIQLCGPEFAVLSGDDIFTLALLAIGGKGVISVVANVAPQETADVVNAWDRGDLDEARNLYFRLLPLCKAMFYETNPVPVKTALSLMGKIDGELRLPLAPLSTANHEKLEMTLREHGLL
jgi:4-hydroxy-tetrahydrodipicolinate synthase